MTRAHQIKLYPTLTQEILLKKSCGVARHSFNWGLAKWKELYEAGQPTSAYRLVKLQNSIKKIEFPFYAEVSKTAPQYAIHNVEKAFKNFFIGNAKYPKFKKKGVKDSFVAIESDWQFKPIRGLRLHVPKIGDIKCAEYLRFEGKINHVVIKRIADMWFAVVNVEITPVAIKNNIKTDETQVVVGVDLGIKTMIVLSNGKAYENPKALRKNLKKLKRYQRGLSRKKNDSKNRAKQKTKLSRLYYKISCLRDNAIHQATTEIVKNNDVICIESLNINGLKRNRKISQALHDVALGKVARQIEYKCAFFGKTLIKADPFYPSSKTCCVCGNIKKTLTLHERLYNCDSCGQKMDRDLNAAKNLASIALPKSIREVKPDGEGSSVLETKHSPSMKQEMNL